MGLRFSEEKVLGLLSTINKALGRDQGYYAGAPANAKVSI